MSFFPGAKVTLTGALTSGNWTGNGPGKHSLDFNTAGGVLWHWALGTNIQITLSGLFTDTQQTLSVG